MNTIVDSDKITTEATTLSSKVNELKIDIIKLVEATKEAQRLKDKAMSYNGKELIDLRETTYTDNEEIITKHFATIKNGDKGMASSGMRTITGVPKQYAFNQISKILNFTDKEIPVVAFCINQGIDEMETTLANIATTDILTADDIFNSNKAVNPTNSISNTPITNNPKPSTGDTGSPRSGSAPTGSSGNSGSGGTGTKPNYQNRVTSNNGSTKQSKPAQDNTTNPSKPNTSNTITFNNNTATKPNTSTNTGTTTKPNTTSNHQTSTNNTTHKSNAPTTETSKDNPTASAVVYTGKGTHPTYEEGTPASSVGEAPIEVLGEDNVEAEDLGNSIINGVERVLPQGTNGKKVAHGSVLIPLASGMTAAAAAGLGGKVLLDKTDNNMFAGADQDDDDDSEVHSHEEPRRKKDDKSWLYGMGVGVAMENEDYEVEDDTPKQETLEDD